MRRFLLLIMIALVAGCNNTNEKLALGTLERNRVSHTATINEIVVSLPIKPGSFVSTGTLLVQLDDTQQKALVAKAEAELNQAKASLDKLSNGARPEEVAAASAKVSGAKAGVVESDAKYVRVQNLLKRKLTSQADLDQALASRDASRANLTSAQESLLVLTNGTREEDLRFAQAHVDAATAYLASEQKRLRDLSIIATRDGILDSLPWNLVERVTQGSPLAILLSGKAPFARVYVPEPYRVNLRVNQKLMVRVDGLDHKIEGTLRWISTEPAFTPYYALNQEERSRLMYLAEVQLPDTESQLPNGVPAQVELP
ncbi:MAG: HlyD family efflux transporter periplasmic adaptor subunit [Kangiellaceae bacterium]|nr:HlyD family efflux transporter periplasmic adaptor subunit [Kangiellaceae bacterium]